MEHLTLRGSVYQFRMRVPQDLKIHYDGREEIKHSLKTKDYSKARGLAAIRTAELETEFAKLRVGIPKQDKEYAAHQQSGPHQQSHQTKGAETDRLCPQDAETCSLLYPFTRISPAS